MDTYNAAYSLIKLENLPSLGFAPAIFDLNLCYNREKNFVNCVQLQLLRHFITTENPDTTSIIRSTEEPPAREISVIRDIIPNYISHQMEKMINCKLTGIVGTKDFKNYGFDMGISGNGVPVLKGGASYSVSTFIDTNATPKGLTMIDRLRSSYGDSLKNQTAAVTIYNNVFRAISMKDDKGKLLFSLILNYFHVYNISFSSIYNGLCFSSILYNASVLSFGMNRMANVLEIPESNADSVKGQMFAFFKRFFKIISEPDYLVHTSSALSQINYNDKVNTTRIENLSYQKILTNSRSLTDVEEQMFFKSMYSYPSVSSDFINFILKLTSPLHFNNTVNDKPVDITCLFTSNFLSSIRHMDILTTYISVVFTLLKQTSHYSPNLSIDTTVFSGENPEPFSVEYNVDLK
jgi:hypothetical protein